MIFLKKICAILVLFVLLFNWSGYHLLTSILEERANKQLESALDNNEYDESNLISIKIPVSYLPYYNNSTSFERVDGQVEIQGFEYKYVKRRIFNDSLELLCIPNPAVMKLKAAKNEFFTFLNDLQHTGADKAAHSHHAVSKNFSTEYYSDASTFLLNNTHIVIQPFHFHYFEGISSSHHTIVEQPPEII